MIKALHFYLKFSWFLLSRKIVPFSLIKEDYNLLAPTYDEYFSKFVEPYSKELVRRLGIQNDNVAALDLACGTGVITLELSKCIGPQGKIVAIDLSEKMLEKAQEKTGQKGDIEFILGDMKETIANLPSDYFDYVTSGWAIGYSEPLKLLKMIKRILKPYGKLGIIENRNNTLQPIRETALKVAQRHPQHMCYIMDLPLRLPKDKAHLNKVFLKAGLKPVDIWEGEIKFNFSDGREVLNWVLHTGASAGFDRIMDPSARSECDRAFIEIMEKDHKKKGGIEISHRFVAGIAEKI